MTESFIHYLWNFRLFNKPLLDNNNEIIDILSVGTVNTDAGPDILTCKVRIGSTIWAGNAEIHINSSDWYKHNHQMDKAYDNIILHIVYNVDCDPICRASGEIIPFIELKNFFDHNLYYRYESYLQSKRWIPCMNQIGSISDIIWISFRERLLINRLERKSLDIQNLLKKTQNNWEEAFYIQLAGNFGMKVNKVAFELLAKSIPYKILLKHRDNLLQIEALLFGQSGLLPKKSNEVYIKLLIREYHFFQNKYQLTPLPGEVWKLLRLRPSNFPVLRISQFAYLIHHNGNLFHKVRTIKEVDIYKTLFNLKASDYWLNHYSFEKPSIKRVKQMGETTIDLLIINTIIPFLFYYGKKKSNYELSERAIQFYYDIPAELNAVTKNFLTLGFTIKDAMDSQALIELKDQYCRLKKCLECSIGHRLLEKNI